MVDFGHNCFDLSRVPIDQLKGRTVTSSLCSRRAALLGTVAVGLTSLASLAVPANAQYSSQVRADLLNISQRLIDYLARSALIAHNNQPPGVYASNGFFATQMRQDTELARLRLPINVQDSSSAPVAKLAIQLMDALWGPFNLAPNAGGSVPLCQLRALLVNFPKIVGEDIAAAISAIARTIPNNGPCQGVHANGFISVYVQQGAVKVRDEARAQRNVRQPQRIEDLLDLMILVGEALMALPTDNHSPWLRAEWQLTFQAVMDSGARELTIFRKTL